MRKAFKTVRSKGKATKHKRRNWKSTRSPRKGRRREKVTFKPSELPGPAPQQTEVVSSLKIQEAIKRNLADFIEVTDRAWKSLGGRNRHEYIADVRKINRDLDQLTSWYSHYVEKRKISESHAAKAKQVIRALSAIVRQEDIAELKEAFRPFKWPSTEIAVLAERHSFDMQGGDGLLSAYGYKVGYSGDHVLDRRHALKSLLKDESSRPKTIYGAAGPARSCKRLRAVAYAIAGSGKRARLRINADMSRAIADWTDDLAWLKRTYYDGRCDGSQGIQSFAWPAF